MSALIREVSGPQDYEAFAELIRAYVAWLRARYAEDAWFITEVLDKQSFSRELENLPAMYGPPNGRTLAAVQDGQVRGCGAYRRIGDGICEMKRLYIPAPFQGAGLGRQLCMALIDAARADGYRLMRLDTGRLLKEAIAMYRSLGFTECAPYYDYPDNLLPYLLFLELPLADVSPDARSPA